MITIIYISDSSKHFQSAIDEYKKRFWKLVILQQIKPSKKGSKEQIIQEDTQNINKILEKKKDNFNIMMSLSWKQLDTIWFKDLIQKNHNIWKNINFVIWWAFGLDEDKLKNIDYKLNLSKLTFPHGLALLVLMEQIYRAFQIMNWRNYHY